MYGFTGQLLSRAKAAGRNVTECEVFPVQPRASAPRAALAH